MKQPEVYYGPARQVNEDEGNFRKNWGKKHKGQGARGNAPIFLRKFPSRGANKGQDKTRGVV